MKAKGLFRFFALTLLALAFVTPASALSFYNRDAAVTWANGDNHNDGSYRGISEGRYGTTYVTQALRAGGIDVPVYNSNTDFATWLRSHTDMWEVKPLDQLERGDFVFLNASPIPDDLNIGYMNQVVLITNPGRYSVWNPERLDKPTSLFSDAIPDGVAEYEKGIHIKVTPPTVNWIGRATTNVVTNAASVDFSVTFSEAVSGVDAGDFAVSAESGISGASVTGVSGSGSAYTVSVNTGSGTGSLGLNIPAGASIASQPSNLPYPGNETYYIDKTAPAVLVIERDGANPTNAASLKFNVSFDDIVEGVDAGDFVLSTTGGISGASVTGVNGLGHNGYADTYAVTVNSGTGDGTIRLDIPAGAGIADRAGNALSGLPFASGESFTIHKTAPTARVLITPPNPTNAASVDFSFIFSENVTGVEADDFMLVTSPTISGAAIASITGSDNHFTVTVNTGTGDGGQVAEICLDVYSAPCGNLRLVIPAEASIADSVGNLLTDLPLVAEYIIDKTAPTVELTPPTNINTQSVDFGVTFSESVMNLGIDDFVLTATTSGASIVSVNGSERTYTVTVNKGTGEGSLTLEMPASATVNDMAGNAVAGLPKNVKYDIDNNLPVVLSVVPDACSGNFLVTFSEAVKDVDATDFELVTGDTLNGVKVTGVSCTDAVCSVAVDNGTGVGTVRLNVPANASITDQAGNLVTKLPYTSGKVYRILNQTLRSTGQGDGWVHESEAGSGVGGAANSTAQTLNVGDDAQNRQFRSILNFPTYYLPDDAGILEAILMLQSTEVTGDPFAALGNISIDIRGAKFVGGMNGLQPGYFEARADAPAVGIITNSPVKTRYWATLDSKANPYINLTGMTQMRLAFQIASNNNGLSEYIKFYSGSYEMQKDRPHLELRYCTPR